MKFISTFILFSSVFVNVAFADSARDIFESLKNSGEKYEIIGTICEQVARLDLQREYPAPRYVVETGISYGNASRTVGELDVIVFDSNDKAVLVGEVKCWKSLSGGLKKAGAQRARFRDALRGGSQFRLWDKTHPDHPLESFKDLKSFVTIAQNGAKVAGYDRELAYSLEDLMAARSLLITCQNSGKCAKPNN